uniref:Superoxide dismutase n=1 Tax=Barbula unguiculata TaxID=96465 RepID=Q84UK3_9BRYO|nr:chloroplastic iron superoxide dismutase [Barbula unguiculata]BAG24134.1 chloroplastic iron superoxide dismutase [Barbula unguiculata]
MAAVPLPLTTVDLRPPPYALDALEPHMSKETLEYHWGKHHRAYVDNLKKQIEGTELASQTLEDIVRATYNNGEPTAPFNNAAQAWNHEFFWLSMSPHGGKQPDGELMSLLKRDFGSYDNFVKEFKQAGATQFGSGWAWLTVADGKLMVEKSPNAINPLVFGHVPILVADVWEHAYYLDYQNRRPDYLTTFMNELVSWDAVAKRLQLALQES